MNRSGVLFSFKYGIGIISFVTLPSILREESKRLAMGSVKFVYMYTEAAVP